MPNKYYASRPPGIIEDALKLLENNRYFEAVNLLDRAILSEPENIYCRYLKANILLGTGKYDLALTEFKAMEAFEHDIAYVYSMESQCLLNLGRNEDAVNAADQALFQDSSYIPAYKNKAVALLNVGFINDALKTYSDAVKLNSEDAASHVSIAEMHMILFNFNAAEKEIKIAIKLDRSNNDANRIMVLLAKSRGDMKMYVKSLFNAYFNTGNEKYITDLTSFLLHIGKNQDAVKIGEKFYRIDPENIKLAENLAHIYVNENKILQARKIFEDLIMQNNDIKINIDYITFLNKEEQYQEVLKIVDSLMKKYPENEEFIYNKFYALSRTEDHENAILIIQKLYNNHHDSIFYLTEYAVELAYFGNYTRAINLLKEKENNCECKDLFLALYTIYVITGDYRLSTAYAIKAFKSEADDNFLITLPEQVIDDYLQRNWYSQALNFINKLIDETEGELKEICMACRACVLGIIDYDNGRMEFAKIHNPVKRANILQNILKFNNEECKFFINRYKNEYLFIE